MQLLGGLVRAAIGGRYLSSHSSMPLSSVPCSVTYNLLGGGGVGFVGSVIEQGGASSWLNKVTLPYSTSSSSSYNATGKAVVFDTVINAALSALTDSARGKPSEGRQF